jgi:hypothetical protein
MPKTQLNDDDIRKAAYDIWMAEGQPEGRDYAHWLQASDALNAAAQAAAKPAAKPAAKAPRKAAAKAAPKAEAKAEAKPKAAPKPRKPKVVKES